MCVPTGPGVPLADLALRNEITGGGPLVAGNDLVFTVNVKNDGPDPTTGVTVKNLLPPGLYFVSAEGDGDYNPSSGIWTIGTLFDGAEVTMELTVNLATHGTFANCAEVRTSDVLDPDSMPNNQVEEEDDMECIELGIAPSGASDLSLSKTIDNDRPKLGQPVTFTLSVTNVGPDPAFGVEVTDRISEIIPTGMTFISASGPFDDASGKWTIGEILVGETASIELVFSNDSIAPKTNTAEVTASGRPDPDSTPNNRDALEDDQASVDILPQSADLSLTKTVDDGLPQVGAEVIFTLNLTNDGPDPCDGVTVADALPEGLDFVSANGDGSYAGSVWNAGSLAVGESKSIDIRASVSGLEPMANMAEIAVSDQVIRILSQEMVQPMKMMTMR